MAMAPMIAFGTGYSWRSFSTLSTRGWLWLIELVCPDLHTPLPTCSEVGFFLEVFEMKLHQINTPIGSALLVEILEPAHGIDAPEGWGLIYWGRCDRATFGALLLSSRAEWIADYDIKAKVAIILWPTPMAGKAMAIDTACVDVACPHCGCSKCSSAGPNWLCGTCGRRWRKAGAKTRGGNGRGQGRRTD
jgi:hypothetical protein